MASSSHASALSITIGLALAKMTCTDLTDAVTLNNPQLPETEICFVLYLDHQNALQAASQPSIPNSMSHLCFCISFITQDAVVMDPSTPLNTRIVIPARPPVDNRPVGVDELAEEFYQYIDHVRNESWAYLILHGMKDAKLIRRLVHITQVDFPEKPAKDGSNLYLERRFQLGAPNGIAPAQGSQALKQMYDYHQAILTGLFSNNLIEVNWPEGMPATGNPPLDISKYTRLNWLLRACSLEALENERARIDYPQWAPNVKTAFEWVPAWMLSIRDGVHAVQDAWFRGVDAGTQDPQMRQQMAQVC